MNGFIRRFSSLVYKETLQVLRDPSTIGGCATYTTYHPHRLRGNFGC